MTSGLSASDATVLTGDFIVGDDGGEGINGGGGVFAGAGGS